MTKDLESTTEQTFKTPGIVIFVAILNFIGAVFGYMVCFALVSLLIFGNAAGAFQIAVQQVTDLYAQMNLALGINLFILSCLFLVAALSTLSLLVGVFLLKRKKFAWVVQIVMSILGLFGFPIGTVLNAVILIFFFQSNVRQFFEV